MVRRFPSSLAIRTPLLTLSAARLRPAEGPDHNLITLFFLKVVFTAVEILSVVVTSSITGTLKNSVSEGGGRRMEEEEEET